MTGSSFITAVLYAMPILVAVLAFTVVGLVACQWLERRDRKRDVARLDNTVQTLAYHVGARMEEDRAQYAAQAPRRRGQPMPPRPFRVVGGGER